MDRIMPVGPAHAYRTFQIVRPPDLRIRVACEAAGCEAWRSGWQTIVDERTALGVAQAAYIRQRSGRTFREQRTGDGLTVFVFEPRQRCFREHATLGERYVARGGDWRGNPTGEHRIHASPADWVEDFGEHQERLAEAIRRG